MNVGKCLAMGLVVWAIAAAGVASDARGAEASVWCNPTNTGAEDGLTKETGFATLWKAFAAMSPGSEVIIADGDWTSHSGMTIEHPHLPPSGSAESYTRIHAETDWEARLPHIFSSGTGRSYVEVRGIVFDSRKTPHCHVVTNWHHTKFIRCGFLAGKLQGNSHTCGFGSGPVTEGYGQYNHHNLMEECIAWGGGRYTFYSKYAKYNVFRRCIARRDYNAAPQIFNFRAYACDDNVFQNCISIDSDRVEHYAPLNHESGGFWIGDQYGTTGNEIRGCISIKDVRLPFYVAGSKGGGASIVNNCAALDVTISSGSTLCAFILTNNGGLEASNILGAGGMVEGYDGFYRKNAGVFAITDSILKDVADYGVAGVECSYINHFNADKGDFGEGSTSYDPKENGLLYPVRIEKGSRLATAGSDGGPVGPAILKQIGVSGTLYGEPGWDEVTDDDLWPFPNENAIKTLMSETVEGVSGIYGFTAYESPFGSPNTLTSYIWEYLGNSIPPEIYARAPAD